MNGFSTGEEDSLSSVEQACCLVDNNERCTNPASNTSYSRRMQKLFRQRRLNLSIDISAGHPYICDFHEVTIQSDKTNRRCRDSEYDSNGTDTEFAEVDFNQLHVNTLRRYKRHYKVPTRTGINKAQLADTLMKHFKTIPVKEKDVVSYFVYTVKTNGNKLEHKNSDTS